MTDTDPRLEAAAKAHRETEFPVTLSWDQREARRFIAMHDALRAFDQAQPAHKERTEPCRGLGDCIGHPHDCFNHPNDCGCSKVAAVDAAAPVMGADPLWLREARKFADTLLASDVPEMSIRKKIAHMMAGFAKYKLEQANTQPPAAAEILAGPRSAWPDPTPEMQASSLFEAIWSVIKTWDIAVPEAYSGYCYATGNHVRAILDAINAQPPSEAEIDAAHRTYLENESDDTFESMRAALVAAAKARSGT